MSNKLYFGDNLHILRRYIKDESVDLIYLDPPFNSKANYNIVFAASKIRGHRAQIQAFEDTWHWNEETEETYEAIQNRGGPIATVMQALHLIKGRSDLMAYLVMMTVRLVEMHRVLKDTGSLYLHCDPAASHYLKIILDAIFSAQNFRNEVVWQRTSSHNDKKLKKYGAIHDSILFYTKSENYIFNLQYVERNESAPKTHDLYTHTDGALYRKGDCRAPGNRGPLYEWNGHTQHWQFSPKERDRLIAEDKIVYSSSGVPRVLRPVDPDRGAPMQDLWTDIDALNSGSAEILGYPTQKPKTLLERIILSSTNDGAIILDPFCGCGTSVHAAQTLGRTWIGIDITHLAIQVIADRLKRFLPHAKFTIFGQPKDLAGAQVLADHDKYQFQWWATWLAGGQPFGGEKKGKDRGVDGTLEFVSRRGVHEWGVISVKGGRTVNPSMVRDLAGTVAREKAAIGVFLCIAEPSREMELEAVSAGFVTLGGVEYRKIQIRTIEQLLQGKGVDCPMRLTTAQKAPEVVKPKPAKPKAPKRAQKGAEGQIPLMLPILGGRKDDAQKALPLAEPLLTAEQPGAVKRRKRG